MGQIQSRLFLVSILVVFSALSLLGGCGGVNNGGGNVGGGGGATPQAVIAIDVQPANIVQGQSATISWQVTKATQFSISPSVLPAGQTYPLAGSAMVSPSQTTTYTATATDSNGLTTTATLTVSVAAPVPPTITLNISPPVVAAGDTATISWTSTNATAVSITPSILSEDQPSLELSGSAPVTPTAKTVYTATASGANNATAQAAATVDILSVNLTASPATIAAGQSATLSWTSNNATTVSIDQGIGTVGPSGSMTVSPAATTTYTITAVNGPETATAQATVNAPLSVSLQASPANITPGQQSTLQWVSRGATSVTIDQGVGTFTQPTGSVPVSPTQTTTYNITATDAAGHTATASATVTVSTASGLSTIKHIIFMLQENRSFDSYFSQLGAYAASRGIANYQINAGYDQTRLMPLISGALAHPFHEPTERTENLTPSWNESHFDIDQQSDGTFKMDRFALTTHSVTHDFDPDGLRALGFYDQTDLPYYYELATEFATSDAFHSSLLSNTFPNRSYLFCATSQGRIRPDPAGHTPWTCPTIFRSLQNAGVKWEYYYTDGIFLFNFQDWFDPAIQTKTAKVENLLNTLASPTADQDLAAVVFIDPGSGGSGLDEHPDNDIQNGAAYIKCIIDALMASPAWHDSVFILAYDEGGGLYDHVPPFAVVPPDSTPPALTPTDLPGDFTLSGFRVPLIVVSPWVKPHFVSHTNRELTSILKLIETRFNLPALTARDAAADDMTEFFDFSDPPALLTPPPLPAQPTNGLNDPTREAPPQ
ncbi:MAG: alkaline phosphatase family protein [Actinomycetota bacterium]